MERKIEIPDMTNVEVACWYETIKPIIVDLNGHSKYLRPLSIEELMTAPFTWLIDDEDLGEDVDYNKLSILEDRLMYLSHGTAGLFKPKVSEVIRQIPKELREKVVAFEVIDSYIGITEVFSHILRAKWRAAVVRLYTQRDDTHPAAHMVMTYPTKDSPLPVGMTEEEFKELFH